MASELTPTLYVFAPLAGEMQLAGRLDWRAGHGTFVYAPGWLAGDGAYALDPRNLPLKPGQFVTALNEGVHGVFADAGPDSWGRALIERDRGPHVLENPLEVLRLANGTGTGALLFSQSRTRPAPPRELGRSASVEELEAAARAFAEGRALTERELDLIVDQGSSLGGAQPKARLSSEDAEYIAKFRRPVDAIDTPRLEWATLELARLSDLDVPNHQLVELGGDPARAALLVERFDRRGAERLHYLSMHALLAMERVGPVDVAAPHGLYTYFGAASLYRRIGVPDAGPRMFERMLFNVLAGNTDDHTRNHGLLRIDGAWDLAPAFDLVPQTGRRHGIGIGTAGREGTLANAFSALDQYGMERARADEMLERMREAFRSTRSLLVASGLAEQQIEMAIGRMPGAAADFPAAPAEQQA